MSWPLFIVIALLAALVTPPVVLLIPRARQSTTFDRLLWMATWLLAFAGAWLAYGYAREYPDLPAVNAVVVAGAPLLPLLAGALAGALFINVSLWVIDRAARPPTDEHEKDGLEEHEE